MLWSIGGGKSPRGSNRNAIYSKRAVLFRLLGLLPMAFDRAPNSSQGVPPFYVVFDSVVLFVKINANALHVISQPLFLQGYNVPTRFRENDAFRYMTDTLVSWEEAHVAVVPVAETRVILSLRRSSGLLCNGWLLSG